MWVEQCEHKIYCYANPSALNGLWKMPNQTLNACLGQKTWDWWGIFTISIKTILTEFNNVVFYETCISRQICCFAYTLICKITSKEVWKWGIFGCFKDGNVKTYMPFNKKMAPTNSFPELGKLSPHVLVIQENNNGILNFWELKFFP